MVLFLLTFEQENKSVVISLKFEHEICCVVVIKLIRPGCPLCCRFPSISNCRKFIVLSFPLKCEQELQCVLISYSTFWKNILHWKSVGRKLRHLRFPVLLTENRLTCLLCNWYLSMVSEVFWNSDVTMTGN